MFDGQIATNNCRFQGAPFFDKTEKKPQSVEPNGDLRPLRRQRNRGVGERGRAEEGSRAVGKPKILHRQAEKNPVEFAVAVFVMKDGEGITPGLEPFEHGDGAVLRFSDGSLTIHSN